MSATVARDTLIGVLVGITVVLLGALFFLARVISEPEVDTPAAAQTAAAPISTPEPTAVAARPAVARPASTPARTATPTPTPSCSIASSSQTVIASTVKVVTGSGTGTAFYVGNSEFITAAHVVEGYPSVRLEGPGLGVVVAQVVGLSSSADVAILRVNTSLKPLKWGDSSKLGVGEFLGVAGYPKGFETSAAMNRGVVSRAPFDSSGQRMIQTDAGISPGNSGGPAFDECGRVIGMVTSKIVDTAVEGVAFAIAESSVRAALPDARAHPLTACATREFNVGAGSTVRWTFGTLSAGAHVSGGFSVEPGGFGDLDVRFHLADQLGQPTTDTHQTSAGTFQFTVASAGARVVIFDNSYSLLTSKDITIKWCQYG